MRDLTAPFLAWYVRQPLFAQGVITVALGALLAVLVAGPVVLVAVRGWRVPTTHTRSEAERREAARRSVNRAYEHDQHWWI